MSYLYPNVLKLPISIFRKIAPSFAFVLISFFANYADAQVSGYTFAASSGSYTAITGTTLQSGTALSTNAVSPAVPLGFTFNYNRKNYTSIFVSNNGFITFGQYAPAVADIAPLSNGNTSGTIPTYAYDGAIAGFAADLVASTAAGAVPVILYGTSGSDFVVQFTDLARTGSSTDRITFQIRLTQSTNKISIVYNTATAATAIVFPQVGLRGGNYTDWYSLTGTTTTTWTAPTSQSGSTTGVATNNTVRFSSTAPAAAPVAGQTYTWTAPAAQSPATYAALPAVENFDIASWANGTSTQDQPNSSNWRTWPAFGNSSWRRNDVSQSASGWTTITSGAYAIASPASGGTARFHNYYCDGGKTAYMDYYVNFSSAGIKSLSFNLIGQSANTINIYLSGDGGATFGSPTVLTTTAAWTTPVVNLGSSTSATTVVRFEVVANWGSYDVGIDNVYITVPAVDPAFTAVTSPSLPASQVNLSATANTSGNNIVVVYNSTGTFTSPLPGVAPTANGTTLAGSNGTIFYSGPAAGLGNHTIASNTLTYYKAYSYNAANVYSPGVAANATTQAIVSTTAPTTITAASALTGGNVTAGGGAVLTARGTAYGTAPSPTTLVSSGTSTGTFTQTLALPSAQTQYYVRAYATNAGGTSYGADASPFYTLSNPPSVQPTSIAGTATSTTAFSVTMTGNATYPATGATNAGYLLLYSSGTPAISGTPNGIAPASVITTGTQITVAETVLPALPVVTGLSVSGLSAGTPYNLLIVPYTWDGIHTSTYNYFITGAKTATVTTLKVEPTNQMTALAATGVTTSAIALSWTAAAGTQIPDGYLVKASNSNLAAITDPVDGIDPADVTAFTSGLANKKITPGTATAVTSFTGMVAGTMYYYKTYSYTNSGTGINFKITTPASIFQATLPAAATGAIFTPSGTTATISWTNGTGYIAGSNSTLVFVKAGSAITVGTPTSAPSVYTANTTVGAGTASQNDASARCVFNGDGTTVTISGLAPGTQYYVGIITVVDASNSTGTNSYSSGLSANAATAPTNDNCSGAGPLTVNTGVSCISSTTGTTVGATQSQPAQSGAGSADDDVWYSFVATSVNHRILVTPSTLTDVVFEVFSGNCGSLVSKGFTDLTAGSTAETKVITGLTIGATYYIRVYSYNSGSTYTGTFAICVSTPADPCSSIINIASCGTTVAATFTSGFGLADSSSCDFATPGAEKIYSFTPAQSGLYQIAQTSSFTTIDYAYKLASDGCGITGWNCIGNGSGIFTSGTVTLVAGTQYYILADPETVAGGSVNFSITCPASDPLQGLPIAYYDFELNSARNTTGDNSVEVSVKTGATSVAPFAGNAVTYAGAGLSYTDGVTNGLATSISEGVTSTITDPKATASKGLQFKINASGFSGLTVNFDEYTNNTNSPRYGILYSLNGSTWTFVGSYDTPGTGNFIPRGSATWNNGYVLLPAACDNQANLYIRIYTYYSQGTGAAAHVRFDNLTVLAKTTVAGNVFTTVDEEKIFESTTSGNSGTVYVRNGFTVTGAGTIMNLGSLTGIDERLTVNSGATLNLYDGTNPQYIADLAGADVVVNSGATLGIADPEGISAQGEFTGNILNAYQRFFSTGANYNYIGDLVGVTGTGLPATVNNLSVINTSAGITATNPITVNGTISIAATSGLDMGVNALTAGTSFATAVSGALKTQNISITPIPVNKAWGGTVYYNGSGAQNIVYGDYNILNASGGDRTLSPAGETGILNSFLPGAGIYTNTGSTLNFKNAGAQSITPFNYYNLSASGSGIKSLAGDISVSRELKLNNSINLNFVGAYNITLKSTAAMTANVAPITGATISYPGTGRFVVERWINTGTAPGQHGKGWQLLSSPTNGQTIKDSWMEGGGPLPGAANGYGTITTGVGGTANGFDIATGTPSMKWYNSLINAWVTVSDPRATLLNYKPGYLIFIRGDRSVVTSSGTPVPTTLRSKGTINTGIQPSLSVPANGFTVIGNPYPSPVDFSLITRNAYADETYYTWDPTLSGAYHLGGYQTITPISVGGRYRATPGNLFTTSSLYNTTSDYRNLQSGQAVFVHATGALPGSFTFAENQKAAATGDRLATRGGAGGNNNTASDPAILSTDLVSISNGVMSLADGNTVLLDPTYNNAVDGQDAIKIPNDGENLGLLRTGSLLAVEARQPAVVTDTLFYNITHLNQQTYGFVFLPENMDATISATLVDKFLNSRTAVSLTDTSFTNFSVTADAASSAADRFMLVFIKSTAGPLPVTFTGITATRNPDRSIAVDWTIENEINILRYDVERSSDGVSFNGILNLAATNSTAYTKNDLIPLATDNYYRIKATGNDGKIQYSKVARVAPLVLVSQIAVYPNPVIDKSMQVKFLNQKAGTYRLELTNKLAQVVYAGTAKVSGTNYVQPVKLNSVVSAGVYQLRITDQAGAVVSQQVLIQ